MKKSGRAGWSRTPTNPNVLNLATVGGYARRSLNNAGVVRYLSKRHGDTLLECQKIAEATVLVNDA